MNEIFNRVYFNGRELSYKVGDVEVINGKFPEEFELKGDYLINAEDLALITALISEKMAAYTRNLGWGALSSIYICDEDNLIKKMEEQLENYKERLDMLDKECKKVTNIKNKIDDFNNLPWYERIFKKIEIEK
jgi:hypothetical protein|nr:MAG TPA: hypothetical protein [Caudoviricetes sp.]